MKLGIITLGLLTVLTACGSSNKTYPVRNGPQIEHPNGTQAMAQQAATVQQAYVNQPAAIQQTVNGNEYNRNRGIYTGAFNGALAVAAAQ